MVGKPLVEASMTGYNSILMAYGQTGAGMLVSSFCLGSNCLNHSIPFESLLLFVTRPFVHVSPPSLSLSQRS